MTAVNVEHFVKSARNVESGTVAVVKHFSRGQLLVGEPFLLENVYSILLRYSQMLAEPLIGEISGSSTLAILRSASLTWRCLQSS